MDDLTLDGNLDRNGLVAIRLSLESLNAWRHLPVRDDSDRSLVRDCLCNSSPEFLEILALDRDDFHALASERLGDVVALEVHTRVTRDGDLRRET